MGGWDDEAVFISRLSLPRPDNTASRRFAKLNASADQTAMDYSAYCSGTRLIEWGQSEGARECGTGGSPAG